MPRILFSYGFYLVVSSLIVLGIYFYRQPSPTLPIPQRQSYTCKIVKVTDGDSVTAICQQLSSQLLSLRLQYIDAPEFSQFPWGKASQDTLTQLLAANDYQVKIQFDGKDVYQRYLAELYINIDAKAINQIMVERGMARVYARYDPPKTYLTAMQAAKKQRRGIWQEKGLHQDPQRYRRLAK